MQPILTVDLTTSEFGQMSVPEAWERDYLGGASLAARILYADLVPDLDPLSPEAPLLFMNGPLTGTAGPAVGRFVVCGLSPATGLWAESNCGGFWGPELRKAGFNGVRISGRAIQPAYLWIEDDRVEIRAADQLWGMDTYQTQSAIRKELAHPAIRVACIGPAGEALIPFALILCDHGRVAGRTGLGAVMGSKNLKAVAVRGNGEVPVSDPAAYNPLRSEANRLLREDNISQVVHELGSASAADYFDYIGEMPKKYFQRGKFDDELQITGASVSETILAGYSTCQACVIACGRVVKLEDGVKRKGPEYETLVGFGPNLCLNDPKVATQLGELCDRYGMDTISLSNTIGLAFSLYEKGVITKEDTGGMALDWGKAFVVEQLVHLTAQRSGFGFYLAEGARALGKQFGAEEAAVQVNGLEVAYHDPRGASGMALVYATSPRGACHNQSDYFLVDVGQVETILGCNWYPARGGAEKAANVALHQNWRTVFNSLVMCFFANVAPETVVKLINAACGLDWEVDDVMRSGERGWNLKRVINKRLGLERSSDKLPKGLLLPYSDDPNGESGYVPDLKTMLDAYYQARGWDPATGSPTRETMSRLGLSWVLEEKES
jgi:aldehyde:ferredoxin oxidoreductase